MKIHQVMLFLLMAFTLESSRAGEPAWTWLKGQDTQNTSGNYGIQGVAAADNRPGGRYGAASWTDASGRQWMFGGYGMDAAGAIGQMNDLWRYDPASGMWTWIKGSTTCDPKGVYGTMGTAAPANTPGGRFRAVTWTDSAGRFWLFGGEGYAATETKGYLNDLWRFDPATGNWTWIKGSSAVNVTGTYGTMGSAVAANNPGGRGGAAAWIDGPGRLWLFGGYGHGASGGASYLGDLWRYDPASGNWTWVKGPSTTNPSGIYNTQGTESPTGTPGGRYRPGAWVDGAGRFWLFGGYGCDAAGSRNFLNDLWRFDPASGQWAWVKGSNNVNQSGIYGTMGAAAPANNPGARYDAVAVAEASGTLLLFGGAGNGISGYSNGNLSDLWRFDPATAQWTWVKGPNVTNQNGSYATHGTAAPGNAPGARTGASGWLNAGGGLFLFGGTGYDSAKVYFYLNDSWRFDRAAGNWAWLGGSAKIFINGVYGTKGTGSPVTSPGARLNACGWTDGGGRFWMFGGWGYPTTGGASDLNDLWRYDPANGQWTWIKGSAGTQQNGVYGTRGTAASANTPGVRSCSASWTDPSGAFWLFGGNGRDSAGGWDWLNDLWRFDPATGNWTWIKGSDTIDQRGAYGTQGSAAAANTPGARYFVSSWMDESGKLWLFGGYGVDASGVSGRLNDLWRFDPATGNWTWVKGSASANQPGVYGTQGVSAAANTPGARFGAAAWRDNSGRLWLFGGGAGTPGYGDYHSDLWRFDPSSGNWTWVKGSSATNQHGVYGTMGSGAAANTPGARGGAAAWVDGAGRLCLFGGKGYAASGSWGDLNDLWRFDPSTGRWTWVMGGDSIDPPGTYGTRGTAAATNIPGARSGAVCQAGQAGQVWLFGGRGRDALGVETELNDLWLYEIKNAVDDSLWRNLH